MNPSQLDTATDALRRRLPFEPEIMVVLGSGLGALAEAVEDPVSIPFGALPGFPAAGVQGHSGRWVAGHLEGRRVLIQAGRFHLYEGHPPAMVVAPVRMGARLGARSLLLTNAAGGIDRGFEPGTLMLIEDHLNWMGRNPLVGEAFPGEPRFPDMTAAYDPALRTLALEVADELGIPLAQGVYAGVLGPTYETPAEIRMLRTLGADAVGMSTVPEVIAANAAGLRVVAISLVTNHAAGVTGAPLSHDEVIAAGAAAAEPFGRLVRALIAQEARAGAK